MQRTQVIIVTIFLVWVGIAAYGADLPIIPQTTSEFKKPSDMSDDVQSEVLQFLFFGQDSHQLIRFAVQKMIRYCCIIYTALQKAFKHI
jgi:hypothetical protein